MQTDIIVNVNKGMCQSDRLNNILAERFLRYLGVHSSSATLYRKGLSSFFSYLYEHNITRPTREDIIAYKDNLSKRCRATTVQAYMVGIRRFFRWMVLENLYNKDVTSGIKGAKISREFKKDYLTSNQVKSIVAKIDTSSVCGLRDYALFILMVTTGLRTIEIVRANREDLRTRGDKTVLYIQGKGCHDKAEYVDITPFVENTMRLYVKQLGYREPHEPLFPSLGNRSRWKRMDTSAIRKIIKKYLRLAGFDSDRLSAHSLRHTAVTLSLLGGSSLAEVQQFARHSSVSTTQIYNHALERENNRCAEVVTNQIF